MPTALFEAAEPFIIQQDYSAYTPAQHQVWSELVGRVMPQLQQHASQAWLDGLGIIGLEASSLPNLSSISSRLAPRTGWSSTPVSGFLPAPAFFEMLAARCFPTTTWLRSREFLDYTPEPDIFHDVFGHVPLHAHPVFAGFLERYGRVCAATPEPDVLEKLGRIFWYTVEFGLIREGGKVKVFGSGLISSHAECRNVVEGHCVVREFSLQEVLNTPVKVDELHKLLFAVTSFDQIYEAMHQVEQLALEGRL